MRKYSPDRVMWQPQIFGTLRPASQIVTSMPDSASRFTSNVVMRFRASPGTSFSQTAWCTVYANGLVHHLCRRLHASYMKTDKIHSPGVTISSHCAQLVSAPSPTM